MAWKKVSTEKTARLEEGLAGLAHEKKPMFGCPAYFVHGNWFAGVHEDNILVKLPPEQRAQLMAAHPRARLFEPFPGRVMKKFVVLPPEVTADDAEFRRWLEKAHEWVSSFPAKSAQPKRKRKRAGEVLE
ncbi:MAG: TfoX/Sxy family protein [Thermodesulfobacteriota bacterium]